MSEDVLNRLNCQNRVCSSHILYSSILILISIYLLIWCAIEVTKTSAIHMHHK
jgi:hypothetical protein